VFADVTGSARHLVLRTHQRLRGRYVPTVEIAGYKPLRKSFRVA
jgi:hypothetical protein